MLLQNPSPYSRDNPQITQEMPAISREFIKSHTPPNNALPALGTRDWRPPLYWNNPLPEEEKFDEKCKKWFTRAMIVSILTAIFLLTSIFLIKLIILVIWLK